MTITHISHFNLTLIQEHETELVFQGKTEADCLRMAYAHGCEKTNPRLESSMGLQEYGPQKGWHLVDQLGNSSRIAGPYGGNEDGTGEKWLLCLNRKTWETQ